MLKRRRTFQAQEVGELDFSEELLELGVLIGSYRTARGIKQEDMAKLLGMSRITLSRIENSWLPLTMENFFKMAAIFEVRPEFIYGLAVGCIVLFTTSSFVEKKE